MIATLTSASQVAFDKAKADCAAGVEPRAVRDALRASLKSAQDQFQSDRQNFDRLRDDLETLRQTRRDAVKAAIDGFKATAEQARKDLKAAFGT
jgi:hypothetical protein